MEFRSKTPSAYEHSSRPSRFDRDYKSMTRFEKTPAAEEVDEQEK